MYSQPCICRYILCDSDVFSFFVTSWWNTSTVAVISCREKSISEEAQRQICPPATHNSHTLLDPARSGAASSLDSTSFGCRHTVFSSITCPWLDVWRSSQPAGTETQVTEQHPQSRTLELRWLPHNNTKAKMWVLTLVGMMSASPHSGTKRIVCNYRIVAQRVHQALWAQQ